MKDSIRKELIEVIKNHGIDFKICISDIHDKLFHKDYISDDSHADAWMKKHELTGSDVFKMIKLINEEACMDELCADFSTKTMINLYIYFVSYDIVDTLVTKALFASID